LVPAKYLVLQISHKVGRLRQRLVALIFELVLKTSPSTRRLIKTLGMRRGAPPSLVELARELGCSRSNVSRRFIQAETKGLSFLQGMPACADLFRSRIDQLRPSRPRHRER
jgi:AraC-like DNA-binding protein